MSKFRFSICALISIMLMLGVTAGCSTLKDAEQLQAYDMSGDSIPSVNSVVGERTVEGASSGTSNGVAYKEYKYASATVSDDLIAYLNVLLNDHGYLGLTDFNVTEIPGSGQIAAESGESGKIIIIDLSYTSSGYTIKISKGEGTLTAQ